MARSRPSSTATPPCPIRKQYGLATTRDGQTEFELVVVQGESAQASQCEYLGTVSLTGLPSGPRGMVKIAVTFELAAECLLTVTAREMATQRQVSVAMTTVPGPGGAARRLANGARGGAPGLSTGVNATVTPPTPRIAEPAVAPAPAAPGRAAAAPAEGGERLLGRLRRLFGGEDGQG